MVVGGLLSTLLLDADGAAEPVLFDGEEGGTMKPPVKMLVIYVDETDLWGAGSLYEAIVRRLRQLGIAGATAQAGMMGFGSHGKVHRKRLFGVSDDKPVMITVVDSEAKIREVLPKSAGWSRKAWSSCWMPRWWNRVDAANIITRSRSSSENSVPA